MPHSDVDSDKFYIAHRNKSNKKNRLQTHIIQYIIARTLGHSLTVELRTLTPSVLVRIQLPQPKIKTPLWRFYFWFVGRAVRPRNNLLLGSTMSRFDKYLRSQIVTFHPHSFLWKKISNSATIQSWENERLFLRWPR